MTVEREQGPELAKVEAVSAAVELYSPKRHNRRQRRMAQTALDGFTIMETVECSEQETRDRLASRVIGQPAAIAAVVEALEGSTVRMPSDRRPIANLAFLGPTGVGKSELARTLAEVLRDGSKKFIKIDCSGFSHGHEVASLIGSPPGYKGSDADMALLTEEYVEGFGTVVLFDEIEKGSEELFNLMLQIMDDGELQLRNGKTTNFRDAIIILTSNLGAKEMAAELSDAPLGFVSRNYRPTGQLDELAKRSFKEFFKPEFINRLTDMVVFHPLDRECLGQILDSKIGLTNEEFEEELGARLSLSPAVRDYLVDIAAQEPHLGARPLVRALDKHIYTTFGRHWSAEAIPEGTHVRVVHKTDLGQADDGESPLVFMSKRDATIRKNRVSDPAALVAAFSGAASSSREIELRRRDDEEDYDDPEE